MRAMVLHNRSLSIQELPTPEPKEGQVLARVLACGICGSDLHMANFMDDMIEASKVSGRTPWDDLRPESAVVMGHEFVAEIVRTGPGIEDWQPGDRVTSVPALPDPDAPNGIHTLGYTPGIPGAYGEYILLGASMLLRVADHLPDTIAATTEPCAVGLHTVRQSGIQAGDTALVMGAGPIGLMVLLWLKKEGVRFVAVSDPSAERRELATKLGADLVVDPRAESVTTRVGEALQSAATGSSASTRPGTPQPDVVFECVGVPGTLQQALEYVRARGQVVVAGVCMEKDQIRPMVGTNKHLTVRFVLGYNPNEYAEALAALADGSIDPSPMITRTVNLDELPEAFRSLADPRDCKVVLVP